jgi:hypothetical protein
VLWHFGWTFAQDYEFLSHILTFIVGLSHSHVDFAGKIATCFTAFKYMDQLFSLQGVYEGAHG